MINHLKSSAKKKKRTVSSLSQVAAGIAGGSLSDSSDGAIIAAKTAKDSVENNSMADDVHPVMSVSKTLKCMPRFYSMEIRIKLKNIKKA